MKVWKVLSWPSFALFSLDFPLYSWVHLKIKGGLYIAAPSLAGRSQQTINPVSNPTFEDEVPLILSISCMIPLTLTSSLSVTLASLMKIDPCKVRDPRQT
uniref:Uncharacterized protein n=1 Tax=Oryzias latipes TaxID=8090 RepID=A0A3B3I4T4_ORYLA